MRSPLLAWCLVSTLASGLYLAVYWTRTPLTVRPPQVSVEPSRLEMPLVMAVMPFKLRLRNLGSSPLHVQFITTSHKALSIQGPPNSLSAGAEATLQGYFDPTGFPAGAWNGELAILSDDPRRPRLTVPVTAGLKL